MEKSATAAVPARKDSQGEGRCGGLGLFFSVCEVRGLVGSSGGLRFS